MAHKIHREIDVPQASLEKERDWKKIGLAACVVIILLVAAILILNHAAESPSRDGPADDNTPTPTPTPSVIIVYTLQDGPFEMASGALRSPSDGNQFVTAIMIIENVSYSRGVSGNPYYFDLSIDNIRYSTTMATYSHPLYNDASSVMPGGQLETAVVFEIPKSVDVSKATLVWDGYPSTGVYMQMVGPGLPDLTGAPEGLLYNVGEASTSDGTSDGMVTYTLPVAIHNNGAIFGIVMGSDLKITVDGVEYRPSGSALIYNIMDGETERMEVTYTIPSGFSDVELSFDDDLIQWSGIPM